MHVLECLDRARVISEGPGDAAVLAAICQQGISVTRLLPCDPADDPSFRELPDSPRLHRLEANLDLPRWLMPGEQLRVLRRVPRDGIGLVLARGSGCWRLALAIADELEVPAVVEVGSAHEARLARRLGGTSSRLMLTVAGPGVLGVLRPELPAPLLPPALRPPASSRRERAISVAEPEHAAIAVVAGPGGVPTAAHLAALRAIAGLPHPARGESPSVLLEAPLLEHPSIRRALGDRCVASSLAPLGHCRDLLAAASAVVVPQALGRPEPALVEAAAAGAIVVASPDPIADWLEDRRTAFRVESPRRRGAWATAIEAALTLHKSPAELSAWRARCEASLADLLDPSHRIAALIGLCSGSHAAARDGDRIAPNPLAVIPRRGA